MARTVPSAVAVFAADLAALAGVMLLAVDAGAVFGRGSWTLVVADAAFVLSGLVGRFLASLRWREGPVAALVLVVAGAAPGVILADRWWIAVAAGLTAVTVAPHLLVARRARIWLVAGALLGLGVLRVGPLAGAAAVGGLLCAGLLSMRLARTLSTAQLRQAREYRRELDDQRAEVADLSVQVARADGRQPRKRQSLVRVAFTRRLGIISAVASAIARELRQVEAGDAAALREAARRCAERAEEIARLAAGGSAREVETALGLLLPRLREQLGERLRPEHHIAWKVPDDLPPVTGSASEWTQILVALAENAVETMAGGGALTIEAAPAESPGLARVTVRDTGSGIPEDLLPHVLESFRSGGRGTKADGLGLALVASMVEALEGTIRLESRPGQGTIVEITVPFYVPEAPLLPADRPQFEGTVLLADDDRAYRQAMRRLLESLGFAVSEADSGTMALAEFTASPERYRLVILDVVMPGTPIEELVVRARELRSDVPVILISGYGVGPLIGSVLALGGVRFLAKPVERDALVATLRDLTTDHST